MSLYMSKNVSLVYDEVRLCCIFVVIIVENVVLLYIYSVKNHMEIKKNALNLGDHLGGGRCLKMEMKSVNVFW